MACGCGLDKKVSEYRRMFTLRSVMKNDCVQSIISLLSFAEMG